MRQNIDRYVAVRFTKNSCYTLNIESGLRSVTVSTFLRSHFQEILTAQGTYPSWIRNGLVQGLQAAMSANGLVDRQTVNYMVTTGPINKDGPQTAAESCTVATAPSFIGLGVYIAENVLEATISVSASIGTPGSGFCAQFAQTSALTGAIAGAFGPVGAGIGAVFGTISAACALTPTGD